MKNVKNAVRSETRKTTVNGDRRGKQEKEGQQRGAGLGSNTRQALQRKLQMQIVYGTDTSACAKRGSWRTLRMSNIGADFSFISYSPFSSPQPRSTSSGVDSGANSLPYLLAGIYCVVNLSYPDKGSIQASAAPTPLSWQFRIGNSAWLWAGDSLQKDLA